MVFWGRVQISLPEADVKEHFFHLLGLWFLAIKAILQLCQPETLQGFSTRSRFKQPSGLVCSSPENVFPPPYLCTQNSPPGMPFPLFSVYPKCVPATLTTPTPGFPSLRVWASVVIRGITRAVLLPSQIMEHLGLKCPKGLMNLLLCWL